MNAAEELYEDYQRTLKQLQERCSHKEETDWIEEWWAPGHSTGRKVKLCTRCNKVLLAKASCHVCLEEFAEDDLQAGDGLVLPAGGKYCHACYPHEFEKRRKHV